MAWVKAQGVIEAGEDKVRIYAKKVDDTTATVAFTYDDIIGELTDINGMGAQRETKEYNGYHYDEAVKALGNSTPNDVSLTENLTTEQMSKVRGYYKNKDMIAIGIFAKGTASMTLEYGYVGQISQWGMTVPNGDTCTLTYGMTVRTERDDFTAASDPEE